MSDKIKPIAFHIKNASIEDVFLPEDRLLIGITAKEQKVAVSRPFYENVNSGGIELSDKIGEKFPNMFVKIETTLSEGKIEVK